MGIIVMLWTILKIMGLIILILMAAGLILTLTSVIGMLIKSMLDE